MLVHSESVSKSTTFHPLPVGDLDETWSGYVSWVYLVTPWRSRSKVKVQKGGDFSTFLALKKNSGRTVAHREPVKNNKKKTRRWWKSHVSEFKTIKNFHHKFFPVFSPSFLDFFWIVKVKYTCGLFRKMRASLAPCGGVYTLEALFSMLSLKKKRYKLPSESHVKCHTQSVTQEKQSLISLEFDEGIPPSDANVIPSSDVKVKAWSPQLDILPKKLVAIWGHWSKYNALTKEISALMIKLGNFYLRPKATQMYEHRCPPV